MRLGIASIQRDRAPWIREWVSFHYLVGFRKFYLFLHHVSDNSVEVVTALKKHFDIQLFLLPAGADRPQYGCYQFAYHTFCHEVDWMAFIDGDEFLFSPSDDRLENPLEEFFYQRLSAIGVYWACFGSSGHLAEPAGLIVENYRQRGDLSMPANRHVKSIVLGRQSTLVKPGIDPHVFRTPLGTYDENLRPIAAGLTTYDPTYRKFRINHYVTQSRSFYEGFKKDRGAATDDPRQPLVRPESWWIEHDRNDVRDDTIDRFVGPLKEILTAMPV
jgi:hypothetical protein